MTVHILGRIDFKTNISLDLQRNIFEWSSGQYIRDK